MQTRVEKGSLKMKLYEKGKIYDYPCGCKFSVNEQGYIHYCNPACKYDRDKPGKTLKGYRYVGWQELPSTQKRKCSL